MHGPWQAGAWDLVWPLFWLIPRAVFGLLLVLPWRHRGRCRRHRAPVFTRETAAPILNERFARGEIDDGEYVRQRSTLEPL